MKATKANYEALISLLWHNAVLYTGTHLNAKTFYVQWQEKQYTDILNI